MKKTLSHYATTIENGVVVSHEGDEQYAVYVEDIQEIQKKANEWHAWVEKNVPNAYDAWGLLEQGIYEEFYPQFEASRNDQKFINDHFIIGKIK